MRRRIRIAVAAAAAALVLLLSQAIPAQASVLVKAGAGTGCVHFKPASLTVHRGTKVVWKAVCMKHTVTAYGGNWSKNVTILRGQTTSRTFKTRGVFKYRCKLHSSLVNGVCSGMCGKVTVGT
jgi:plastocyanin